MGQDPDAIRQDIESTREQMGETIDAIGYKADVKSRAKESVGGAASRAKESVGGAASRAKESVGGSAQQAAGVAQENPLGLAVGAVAAGFIAGMLIPSTRVEDERLGPVADQVKDQAKQTGQEAVERSRQVAEDVAQSVQETAKESGRQQAEELTSSASPS